MSEQGNPPAGWYPAPDRSGQERWWDGTTWSDQYRSGQEAPPPPSPGPSTPPPGTPPPGQWAQGAPPPGQWGQGPPAAGPPSNYLVQAILVTIFCCLPLGIVSIVKAAQVNSFWQTGQAQAAHQASDDARKWAWISFGVGLAVIAVYVLAVAGTAASRT